MSTATISIAERIKMLKNIFNDFGIKVEDNSTLDRAIQAEFGRGKRSKLNKILQEFKQESDAVRLAACIGVELSKNTDDPQLVNIGNILQQRIPSILNIVDIKQQTAKRELLLVQLLEHFENKLPINEQTDRLLRMLHAAKNNLHSTLQVQGMGKVIENAGTACSFDELSTYGKMLQLLTPALIVLDQDDVPLEQKINHCVNALRGLGYGLRVSNLQLAANIIDNVHSLAKVALPALVDKASIEQGLHNLGISVGNISTKIIIAKAQQTGLTEQEITQIIYASAPSSRLAQNDMELLCHVQQNQQYAAICGYIAQLAREIKQPKLEKIGIAGICLASLRQTYYELKTNNLQATNLSESLGTILTGVGVITKNTTMIYLGKSILEGVKTYTGIMAVPGGAAIAIPLAVCSVLGKMLLIPNEQNVTTEESPNVALCKILEEVVLTQKENRQYLVKMHGLLQRQHKDLILALEQGFDNLEVLVKKNNLQTLQSIQNLDYKLDSLQYNISKEFSDLYLEYVYEPLEAIDFANKYG